MNEESIEQLRRLKFVDELRRGGKGAEAEQSATENGFLLITRKKETLDLIRK